MLEELKEETKASAFLRCPQLLVQISHIPIPALLDTGSQVTCISEVFYTYICERLPVTELPVTNMVVTTAIGKKSTSVKKQILLEITFGDLSVSSPFLIIPYLTSPMILGSDWFYTNRVVVDYDKMTFKVRDYVVPEDLATFDKWRPERLISNAEGDVTYIQVLTYNELTRLIRQERERVSLRYPAPGNNDKTSLGGCRNNPLTTCASRGIPAVNNNPIEAPVLGNEFNGNYLHPTYHNMSLVDDATTESTHEPILNAMLLDDAEEGAFERFDSYQSCHLYTDGEDQNFFEDVRKLSKEITDITPVQQQNFCRTISKFKRLFSEKAIGGGTYEHQITLTNPTAIVRRSYPIPLRLRKSVEQELDAMLKNGVIERSVSPYCNPLRIVQKKDGRLRICLDARFLNQVIESDNESPPLITDLMQKYHGVNLMSTSDLANGYRV